MLKKLCAVAAACLSLSACAPISFNVEELMRPPKLSAEQNEVYSALTAALGTQNVKLKYPRDGQYRSAFTFYDIDRDDLEEAFVLYEDSEGACWVNIMDKSSGKWESMAEFAGSGADIDTIRFCNITTRDSEDIVIGWVGGGSKTLGVYRYERGEINQIFSGSYDRVAISDLDGDHLDDLVLLFQQTDSQSAHAQLVRSGITQLEMVSDVSLTNPITSFMQVRTGQISPLRRGVVVDGRVAENQMVSELLTIENGELVLPLSPNRLSALTRRNETIYSTDVTGDKIVDIPAQTPMPGYTNHSASEPVYLTTYRSLTEQGFTEVAQGFVNTSTTTGGYAILFPKKWYGKVSAVRQAQTGEIIFFKFNESLSDQSVELLRIRVNSNKDYQDKFENGDYRQIATKGIFTYYAYAVDAADPLRISNDELNGMFRLMQAPN